MAVSNIFKQSNMQMGNVSVEYLILLWNMLFLKWGYLYSDFTMTDELDILKWNDL